MLSEDIVSVTDCKAQAAEWLKRRPGSTRPVQTVDRLNRHAQKAGPEVGQRSSAVRCLEPLGARRSPEDSEEAVHAHAVGREAGCSRCLDVQPQLIAIAVDDARVRGDSGVRQPEAYSGARAEPLSCEPSVVVDHV